jgi:hypothetical protein
LNGGDFAGFDVSDVGTRRVPLGVSTSTDGDFAGFDDF